MSNKQQNYQPLTVENPFTGELVDVYPFFEFLDEIEINRTKISIETAEEQVKSVTEVLGILLDDEYFETRIDEFKRNMRFLFLLQNFLNQLTVYKKEVNNA